MTATRQMILGAFFVIVIGVLGYFTLFLTDFSLFKEEHPIVVQFDDANGLRQGDSVLVAGLRLGRVANLVVDYAAPIEKRITVTLKMDELIPLREGFTIMIQDSTFLGGKEVEIDPGPPSGTPVPEGTVLAGSVAHNPIAALGEMVEENRESVTRFIANMDLVIADLQTGKGVFGALLRDEALAASARDGIAKFQRAAENASTLTDDVRAGKGVMGRLFTDEELGAKLETIGDKLATISADLELTMKDVREGKGLLGRAIHDEKLAEDAAKAIETLRDITNKINTGEGTLGRLVTDPSIADDFKAILEAVRRGDNTIGLLLTERDIYDKVSKAADDLTVASDAIRNAKGTLGKFIMDDSLYVQVQRALATVQAGLEEYREAAPISTFTGVLFSAF